MEAGVCAGRRLAGQYSRSQKATPTARPPACRASRKARRPPGRAAQPHR